MKPGVLTPIQTTVSDRVLDEESRKRRHLVVSLSGAHAYGFASPDSDLDLKAIHIDATDRLLGLAPLSSEASRMEVIDGVEIDYTSNELHGALRGILKGNGNYIERVLGAFALRESPELASLRPLVARSLSVRAHHHYRGFASGQLAEWEKTGAVSAKKLLYVLRTTLTGAHLLRAGEVVTDVTLLWDEHGLGEGRELLAIKQSAEKATLPVADADRWRAVAARAFAVLESARASSRLPPEPQNVAELDAWLIDLRRRHVGASPVD